jgi:SAM-dependent methyltransferase
MKSTGGHIGLGPDRDGTQTGPMTAPTGRTSDSAEWDERYGAAEQVWSGEPNAALVAEAAGLEPGRALDVGCGEGADAVWLARRGWQVTGLDVSQVAIDRARGLARDAGVHVAWVQAGLVEAALPAGVFDLVSAQYPALRKTPGAVAERTLLDLVAPGGTLLLVHHAIDPEHRHEDDFDPALYVLPADVRALLGEGWTVEVDERRPRAVSRGAGAHHVEDLVLGAQRG